jgi:signal transduction histidine kinase
LEDLSLHILDIVENAIAARAKRIEILVVEEPREDRLTIEIRDDGIGMDEEASQKAVDPSFWEIQNWIFPTPIRKKENHTF